MSNVGMKLKHVTTARSRSERRRARGDLSSTYQAPCRSVRRRVWCSAASPAMLRPDGAHLFVGRKLAPRDFLVGGGIGRLPRRATNHGLLFPCQLQEHAGTLILYRGGRARTVSTACSRSSVMRPLYHTIAPAGTAQNAPYFCNRIYATEKAQSVL